MTSVGIKELLNSSTPAVKLVSRTKGGKDAISISVMCYDENKIYRITLSNMLYQKLGSPEELQFAFNKKHGKVLLASKLQNCKDFFYVKGVGGKYPRPIISSRDLVNGFVSNFELDFSQKHNQTFDDIAIDADGGIPVAIVSI
jgi:hypothetical protein